MIIRKVILAALVLGISGCISLPKTESDIKANNFKVETKCVDNKLHDAYRLIAVNTARCHGGVSDVTLPAAGTFITSSSEDKIESYINPDNSFAKVSVEHINPLAGGYLQLIELSSTKLCRTEIKVYVLNDTTKWETSTESVFKWLDGDKTACFDMF